ncbi:MAG TPA: hypothetical protein VGH89_33030 [Pseudonocardia sp.]|jgi:hypothetical protein
MNRALYATTTAVAAVLASLFFAMGTAAAATPAPASASSLHFNRHHDWDDWGYHRHHHHGHFHYHGFYRGGAPDYDEYFAGTDRAGISSLATRYFGVYADPNVVHDYPDGYTNCENEPGPGVSKWACTKKKFTVPPAQQ